MYSNVHSGQRALRTARCGLELDFQVPSFTQWGSPGGYWADLHTCLAASVFGFDLCWVGLDPRAAAADAQGWVTLLQLWTWQGKDRGVGSSG